MSGFFDYISKAQKNPPGYAKRTQFALRPFSVLFCLSAVLFALLLIRAVAGACHSTVGTVAAAGGFAFLFILDKIVYNQCHDNGKHKAYYNGCNIL
jgi:hypothetical protein